MNWLAPAVAGGGPSLTGAALGVSPGPSARGTRPRVPSVTTPLSKDVVGLAAILGISGVIHLGKPEVYEPIMPKVVPAHRAVIFASGVAEILCAAGLLVPRLRRSAGWASAALLLAVYPANLKMAGDAAQTDSTSSRRSPGDGCRCRSRWSARR